MGEKAVEGKGEGWGGGACGHSRGGVYTATGHDGGGGDMTCPQICTWTGRLICGRSGMEERIGKRGGRKTRIKESYIGKRSKIERRETNNKEGGKG